MRLVIISDTHCFHKNVIIPEGDVFVHCGDFTSTGYHKQVSEFCNWLSNLDFKHKICLAGNHDLSFENLHPDRKKVTKMLLDTGSIYLQDSHVEIENVLFYGSPWQPEFCNWAFNLPRGNMLKQKWKQIPDSTNVLITHCPPYKILDLVENNALNAGRDLHQGCADLAERVTQLQNLKLHCFGHLHLNGGQSMTVDGKQFVNAFVCNEAYYPINKAVVVDI